MFKCVAPEALTSLTEETHLIPVEFQYGSIHLFKTNRKIPAAEILLRELIWRPLE